VTFDNEVPRRLVLNVLSLVSNCRVSFYSYLSVTAVGRLIEVAISRTFSLANYEIILWWCYL